MRAVLTMFVLAIMGAAMSCGGASGSEACDDAAAEQCSIWRSCFCPSGSCEHAGVSLAEGDCESELGFTCDQQASTLELPGEDVNRCVDQLATWTCDNVYGAEVQNRPTTPEACGYFF
jgi:hypothetical protein